MPRSVSSPRGFPGLKPASQRPSRALVVRMQRAPHHTTPPRGTHALRAMRIRDCICLCEHKSRLELLMTPGAGMHAWKGNSGALCRVCVCVYVRDCALYREGPMESMLSLSLFLLAFLCVCVFTVGPCGVRCPSGLWNPTYRGVRLVACHLGTCELFFFFFFAGLLPQKYTYSQYTIYTIYIIHITPARARVCLKLEPPQAAAREGRYYNYTIIILWETSTPK